MKLTLKELSKPVELSEVITWCLDPITEKSSGKLLKKYNDLIYVHQIVNYLFYVLKSEVNIFYKIFYIKTAKQCTIQYRITYDKNIF